MYYLNTKGPQQLLKMALDSSVYIDKSLLIEKVSRKINTTERFICITKPRRFGKSINANMLAAYYSMEQDNHALFDGLFIAQSDSYAQHLNQHNVIFIDFSRMPDYCPDYTAYISDIQESLREDILEAYPHLSGRRISSLNKLLNATGAQFIFIFDEWDSIFYKDFMTETDKKSYLTFLENLLKGQPYVELAYMTGVLPIAKYSSGSALNMFDEFSFLTDNIYDRFFGFTEEEVKALCKKYTSPSFAEIKHWYDGYYTSDGQPLFNPRSVNNALTRGVCLNYWTETGPMNEIADCIEHNIDEVREDIIKLVAGIPVEVKLSGYSASDLRLNSRDEILSAMVVYGFLSYHDQTLRIPNHELMEKFQTVLARKSMGEVKAIVDRSRDMLEATINSDVETVASILEIIHDQEIPFLQYNDENALSCVITLCYLYARDFYEIERESKSGKGYCDYLFTPKKNNRPAIILELKVDGTCEEAIAQIREKNYVQKVRHCSEILLVGINYNKATKKHQCRIETF